MDPQAIAQIYASDIVSGFDLHKPEKMNELFTRYDDQGLSMFNLIRSMGFEKEVANDTYGHFEDNLIHETVTVRANVSQPAVGADIVFVLDANSIDANNNFYPREYDTILFNNDVTGYISDIDVSTPADPTITVKLNDATDQFPALVADEIMAIVSNSFSEGSGQPDGAIRGAWEYDNDAQIIKETIGMTGSEMVNQMWVNVTREGQKIPAYYFLGQTDIDYRTALRIDGALLFQKRTVNAAAIDPDTNRPIKTTEGLFPYIRRIGNIHPYTIGSMDIADFDEINLLLDRQFAGNHILSLLGIKAQMEMEDLLKLYFADTDITFARQTTNNAIFNSNESLGASVNFKYLTKGERTYMFRRFGNLSNPQTVGAYSGTTGYQYDYPSTGVFLPINRKKDPKSKNLVESIGVRYRGMGHYSRRMEVWNVGGAGPGLKVTEFDSRYTYQRCHMGAHFRGGNQFVLLDPS
jgi:hypothetical protein